MSTVDHRASLQTLICHSSYQDRQILASLETSGKRRSQYSVIAEAFVESGLVTWVGLLMYEISSLAPTGGITVRRDDHH